MYYFTERLELPPSCKRSDHSLLDCALHRPETPCWVAQMQCLSQTCAPQVASCGLPLLASALSRSGALFSNGQVQASAQVRRVGRQRMENAVRRIGGYFLLLLLTLSRLHTRPPAGEGRLRRCI